MKQLLLAELRVAKAEWRLGIGCVALGFVAAEVYYRFPFYRAAFENFILGQ